MSIPVPPPRVPRFHPGYSADLHWALYQRTGEFFHLMGAYVGFVETARELPDDLLLAMHRHFRKALGADDAGDAREALGVKGPSHWRERKRTERAVRLSLLRELSEANGPVANDDETRRTAARMLHGNPGSIRTEYYNDRRTDAPLGDIAMSERFIQWVTLEFTQTYKQG